MGNQIIKWLNDKEIGVMTLYVNEPDHSGHKFGPHSVEVQEAVQKVDHLLGYILQEVRKKTEFYDDLNIVLTSDHGMAQLDNEEKVILLDKYINIDDLTCSNHYVDYYTGGHIWCKTGYDNCEVIYKKLKGVHEKMQVYYKHEIPERFHYSNHYRIPDILIT